MDAGYGVDTDLRMNITALGLSYVAGIQSHTTVWAPGTRPRPPKKWLGRGRRPELLRRDDKHKPASVKELALGLPRRAWRKITWRKPRRRSCRDSPACAFVSRIGTTGSPTAGRVRHRLLIEWPDGEKEPIKYWLSTLPENIALRQLVDIAKLRWRIERDYQELKQESRAGAFRRAGMARLPPSRHTVHRRLRIPDLRVERRFPLKNSSHHAVPANCPTRRLPAQRSRRCGLNATSRIRLQRCDGDWWSLSSRRYRVARAAPLQSQLGTDIEICDTVRLEPAKGRAPSRCRKSGE